MNGKYNKYNWFELKDQIIQWIEESNQTISKADIALKLNVRIATLDKNLKKIGIDYKGNQSMKNVRLLSNEDMFIEDSPHTNSRIRQRIEEDNLIEYRCFDCNIVDTWNGKPIKLQLDHINGIRNDNRLENLRWLCPNCHSQTETFCRGGRRDKKNYTDKEILEALEKNNFIVDKTLRSLYLTGAGNYKRIYKLIAKHGVKEGKTTTYINSSKKYYHKICC